MNGSLEIEDQRKNLRFKWAQLYFVIVFYELDLHLVEEIVVVPSADTLIV